MLKRAFTMVEIAIALVVVAVLSFGIASASSMYQGMQIKSVIFDVEDVSTAYTNFRGVYNQVPGDMPYAASYWSDCAETNSNCNGNGDGIIEVGNTASSDEVIKAWKHLSKSEFFNFSSDPISDSHDGTIIPGENSPAANIDGVGYFLGGGALISSSGGAVSPFINAINTVYIGCAAPAGTHDPLVGGGLTPEIAFEIDRKIDDGYINMMGEWTGASTGKIRAFDGLMFNTGDCYNGNVYNSSASMRTCVSGVAINYIPSDRPNYTQQAQAGGENCQGNQGNGQGQGNCGNGNNNGYNPGNDPYGPPFPEWMPEWMQGLYDPQSGWPEWIPDWVLEAALNGGG